MSARENFADIYLRGMRDRRKRSRTELARKIQLTDWSTVGNLSNRSSGVQIPRDICTRFGRHLYSTKCSWIIILNIPTFSPAISWKLRKYPPHLKSGHLRKCLYGPLTRGYSFKWATELLITSCHRKSVSLVITKWASYGKPFVAKFNPCSICLIL